MPKIYLNKDVYTAAMERFDIIFKCFDNVYFSVSGGKDSSVMLQLAARKAREYGKKFSVLYIDLEAQYAATIEHIEALIEEVSDVLDIWYWIAMPLSLRNAVSVIQPKWICWDEKDKHKWVRDMPVNKRAIVINEHNYPKEWDWFERDVYKRQEHRKKRELNYSICGFLGNKSVRIWEAVYEKLGAEEVLKTEELIPPSIRKDVYKRQE